MAEHIGATAALEQDHLAQLLLEREPGGAC
jgi:hypothetical protein